MKCRRVGHPKRAVGIIGRNDKRKGVLRADFYLLGSDDDWVGSGDEVRACAKDAKYESREKNQSHYAGNKFDVRFHWVKGAVGFLGSGIALAGTGLAGSPRSIAAPVATADCIALSYMCPQMIPATWQITPIITSATVIHEGAEEG